MFNPKMMTDVLKGKLWDSYTFFSLLEEKALDTPVQAGPVSSDAFYSSTLQQLLAIVH
jgi:hypothetical protein